MRVSGAVLAGGESKRMGRDKKWINLRGKSLLEIAIDKLREVTDEVIVVLHKRELELEANMPRIRFVYDLFEKRAPILGLHSALYHCKGERVLVTPVDTPLIPIRLLRELIKAAESTKAFAVRSPLGLEPLIGMYHKDLIPLLEKLIREGNLSLRRVFENLKEEEYREFAALDYDSNVFKNINTPEDLESL